jgi:peptide/nickel transport system permease protein
MKTDTQRTFIAVIRKIVFAGLVLLIAWLILLGLRGTISVNTINQMREQAAELEEMEQKIEIPLNPWSWDWSKSLWTGEPVAERVGARVWPTLGYIGVVSGFSLVLALFYLLIGQLISRVSAKPGWSVKTRGVLRLIVISLAVSAPIYAWETLATVYPWEWWGVPIAGGRESPNICTFLIAAFTASALPAWLLVQYGHGEIAKRTGTPALFDGVSWRHLTINMAIKILRLVGLIIVVSMFVGLSSTLSGMGRIFVDAVSMRDYPVISGIVWTIIVIVVMVKLAVDLIEITYNHFKRQAGEEQIVTPSPAGGFRIPRWLLVTCLSLVAVSLIISIAAPLIAPYGVNEMTLSARLLPPSAEHILGTDNLGRDVFSRLIYAIREDLFFSLLAAGVIFLVAAGWGMLGARVRRTNDWRGDTLEDMVMLPRDVLYACPWLILLLLLVNLAGYPFAGTTTGFSVGIAMFTGLVLLPRAVGMVQEAYHNPPQGKKWLETVLLSLPMIFLFTVAGGILYIAATSYLGFGVPPPTPELGGMLAGPARRYFLEAPWMALWPPAILIILMTVWVMTGDVLLERLGFRSKGLWSKIWE